jgi:hypothetical protein
MDDIPVYSWLKTASEIRIVCVARRVYRARLSEFLDTSWTTFAREGGVPLELSSTVGGGFWV